MYFYRTMCQANTGVPGAPRMQLNAQTPHVDASMVYGVDETVTQKLRSGINGKLFEGANRLLPAAGDVNVRMENSARRVPGDQLFAAGNAQWSYVF